MYCALPPVPVVDRMIAEALVAVLVIVVDAAIAVTLQEIAGCVGRDGRLWGCRGMGAEATTGASSDAGAWLRKCGVSISSVGPKGGHGAATGQLSIQITERFINVTSTTDYVIHSVILYLLILCSRSSFDLFEIRRKYRRCIE